MMHGKRCWPWEGAMKAKRLPDRTSAPPGIGLGDPKAMEKVSPQHDG